MEQIEKIIFDWEEERRRLIWFLCDASKSTQLGETGSADEIKLTVETARRQIDFLTNQIEAYKKFLPQTNN